MPRSYPKPVKDIKLAIIVPCHNEQDCLIEFANILKSQTVLHSPNVNSWFCLFVNDGSSDNTWDLIQDICQRDSAFMGLSLSRNFGHQIALYAGLEYASKVTDVCISMDADLQHHPKYIEEMLRLYLVSSYEIVNTVRISRNTDGLAKRYFSTVFYWILSSMGVNIIPDSSDFRLLSSAAVESLIRYGDKSLFIRGIVPQLGFKQALLEIEVLPRSAGSSSYTFKRMLKLAIDGIGASTVRPLRASAILATLTFAVCMAMVIYVLCIYLTGQAVPGWSSVVLPIYFLFALNFCLLGIIGEYVGRTYTQALNRPLYLVEKSTWSGSLKWPLC
jgi:glycosyltransferase involved in cell wall biosynthesis